MRQLRSAAAPLLTLGRLPLDSFPTDLDEARRTYRKLVFKDGTLVGAILVGPNVNLEAGLLHNFIRTRQSFTAGPDQLTAGPIVWGRILRNNRLASLRN